MQIVESISEDEMIASFLKAEIDSPRFGKRLKTLLQAAGIPRTVVDSPDWRSAEENAARARVLGDFRGFRKNRDLFRGFPSYVRWSRQRLTRDDLQRVHYVDYAYWNMLSQGTRLPLVAALAIRSGLLGDRKNQQIFADLETAVREKRALPEMILVGAKQESRLVVLEGHARLTAYFLVPRAVPEPLTAIVGFSDDLIGWMNLPG